MNIRIIAGTYGGRTLQGSATSRTHPMSERVRGSLFNMIADELPGAIVLDTFAGSGALGIEAISRGAQHATFVEKDRAAQQVISENITLLNLQDSTQLVKAPVKSWCDTYSGPLFDVIFADPPYHDPQFSTALSLITLLKPNGLMVLSYPGRGEAPTANGVVVVDNRSYGTAALAFYRRKDV